MSWNNQKAELAYFAKNGSHPPAADDVSDLYEDAAKVLRFLGAVACAMGDDSEDEEGWLPWLAEDLTKEAARRLDRLRKAGLAWQSRAKDPDLIRRRT